MLNKGREVLQIINSSGKGAEARFVGGCVRNSLIDGALTDIDIATNLTPDEVTQVFESKKIRVIPTGIDFGTVTIVHEGKNYEITTLRADIETDGRHAKVAYTKDWKEDASRRDFTFNALYMDVDGNITDYFNGQEDLKKGIVRFIGKAEERIKEDYLRILRMFRFHAYYGKEKLLKSQLDAVKSLSDGLSKISGERVHTEMTKLLSSPNAEKTLEALTEMVSTKILQLISSINEKDFRVEKLSNVYNLVKEPNPIVSLATILCSKIPDEQIDALAEKWRLSNKELRFLHRLREALTIDFKEDYQIRKSCRINGKDEFYDYIILNYAKGRVDMPAAEKLIKFAADFAVPDFPLKSHHLIEAGIQPGKKMGDILRKAEELWERDNYKTGKEELLKKII
jgi:poly(A) polymerase